MKNLKTSKAHFDELSSAVKRSSIEEWRKLEAEILADRDENIEVMDEYEVKMDKGECQ